MLMVIVLEGDGTCAIEPRLALGKVSARAKPRDAAAAATVVIRQCVGDHPSIGGMAYFGDDNDLVVTISKFTPNVECTGQVSSRFSIAEACQGSLDKMTTMKGDLKLSSNPPPPLQPRIKQLPFYMDYFTRRDVPCTMVVSAGAGLGASEDYSSSYSMWEASVAINAMCIKNGRNGVWRGAGKQGHLEIHLYDKSSPGPGYGDSLTATA